MLRPLLILACALALQIICLVLYGQSSNTAWLIPLVLVRAALVALTVRRARQFGKKGVAAFFGATLFLELAFLVVEFRYRDKKTELAVAWTAPVLSGLLSVTPSILMFALLISGFGTLNIKAFRVPSPSMSPTLELNARFLATKITDHDQIANGDIVTLHPPAEALSFDTQYDCIRPNVRACAKPGTRSTAVTFIKRIAASPGDTFAMRNGEVVLNGKTVEESYAQPCKEQRLCNLPKVIRIPADHYFLLGDNRGQSIDSRFWGPVPASSITYKAKFVYRPSFELID